MQWLNKYIKAIDNIRNRGDDTELSYRSDIQELLRAAVVVVDAETATLNILHEPKRQKGNSPDFRITNEGGAIVGYVECKKPGADLTSLIKGEQLKKYNDLSPNIILTDGWRWILLRVGNNVCEVTLSLGLGKGTKDDFIELLKIFLTAEVNHISDAKHLAESLARRCEILRQELSERINDDSGKLSGLFDAFQKLIYRDMTEEQFADAFAQTTIYSLLMAKLKAGDSKKLDIYSVKKYIPQTFALIRELSGFLSELDNNEYGEFLWTVNDILAIVNNINVVDVIETMTDIQKIGATDSDDPFLYFYENFLSAYNKELRQSRGVYYTPLPIVRFIIRSIDDILKNEFNMNTGLTDRHVTALDFATGTGTFMLEVMRLVLDGKSKAECKLLTKEHLLPNCYGFEFLIAPYAIAHLKLSQFLESKGCEIDENQTEKQLNIFLTNTLEKATDNMNIPLLPWLSKETHLANKIKESKILVIMGNPPYSGHSQTASKKIGERKHKRIKNRMVRDIQDTWINFLLSDYYQVDGAPLGERNPKWLQDDYVKFIRFAQYKMEQAGRGIVAIITNHGFLDNPTFRGMRQSLMGTFDQLYFLDLHGNSKKKETAPDGSRDENVFDIQQGVSISLLIKNSALEKGIFHYDVFGIRNDKYNFCEEKKINEIQWERLEPEKPHYLFIPYNKEVLNEYQKFTSIKDIFNEYNVGIVTGSDITYIHYNKKKLQESISNINKNFDDSMVETISYRPFDSQLIYYDINLLGRPRENIMRHFLSGNNLGLIARRSQLPNKECNYYFVSDNIISDGIIRSDNRGSESIFPLYLYVAVADGTMQKLENIKPEFREWINEHYNKKLSPENIMGYIYAKLHSPYYRRYYAECLRMDFPRVPFTKDIKEFNRLAKIGNKLIKAHLLKDDNLNLSLTLDGSNLKVEKIRYSGDEKKLFINNETYFSPLATEIFNFAIGGYKPLDKYLKSRKNQEISLNDVETIKKTTAAIIFTMEQMKKIDKSK